MIKIRKGLHLPLGGAPQQQIDTARPVGRVAVLGREYIGMRPTMEIAEGDSVARGQVLFTDKKNEGVRFTSPVSGRVAEINRGHRRVLLSVVIEVDGDAEERFASHDTAQLGQLSATAVTEQLVQSGLWTSLRTRPFSRIPAIGSSPHSIFVTAIDTNPLAADPRVIIDPHRESFAIGLDVLARLTEGPVFVCTAPDASVPVGSDRRISVQEFAGIHPAGLPGTHIHFLDPVGTRKKVWYIGYQDVIAIGKLFATGSLWNERVVALGGPGVTNPRLLRTVLGASIAELTSGELKDGEQRVISGSVFSGSIAAGPEAYVGRYHNQISVLPEGRQREMLGYMLSGGAKHSVFPVFPSRWFRDHRPLNFTTSTNGSPRGMVAIGTYEAVMPLDILATPLLRALLVGDLDTSIKLGCLELDEDDIALCTYACPSKYEYGPVLRNVLTIIEKEG
jgi:Na+-transporting NADH:ubiquinone oxidoreductase subunit A